MLPLDVYMFNMSICSFSIMANIVWYLHLFGYDVTVMSLPAYF